MKSILLSLLFSCGVAAHAFAAEDLPGYERMTVLPPDRALPVAASLWYPAGVRSYRGVVGDNPVFHGASVWMGAKIAEGQYPLFVFSHGSGGNMENSAWLFSALVEKGAMVLAVNHPGSTSGDSSPRASLYLDRRAGDISAALDALLADPVLGLHVDRSRITALGFSLGGATVLNLGGLRFDRQTYRDYCQANPKATDCGFLAKGNVDLDHLPEGFSADGHDDRIGHVIAIDPAFTYTVTEASVEAVTVPVSFINLGDRDRLKTGDVSENGSNLANRLADADYQVIAPSYHITFLGLCKSDGAAFLAEEQDDPVCTDPDGVDRADTHERIIKAVAASAGL
ncbi:alpha/beta hydrolase family protein [Martelella mediterranea]|uniref:Putative dienelactone hydrolase n=1 Tax=Martelella mediterranea DSM 17316 TaxID=1122214 RepID=A0A1U9Z714_9HYPH|nr:alpha/beta fold hydrolase [Martelella mediterranea]AQZ53410.1 putative dienelactone hydrolase [Martelella mediterranea DSM 17316]